MAKESKDLFKPARDEEFRRFIKVIIALGVMGIALTMSVFMCGCVKTVYLPEDAAYYKAELENCRDSKAKCERLVEECAEWGLQLMRCP